MNTTFIETPLPEIIQISSDEIPLSFADAAGRWLAQKAQQLMGSEVTPYVLIHADDGVIWGRVEEQTIVTAISDTGVPMLRSQTVQHCRVFSPSGELYVWRVAEGVWRGRVLLDNRGGCDVLREKQVLWGTRATQLDNDFTLLEEPGQGFRHVVPIQTDLADNKRVVLTVVHYLSEDEDGQSRVVYSRLYSLETGSVQ